MEAEAIVAYVVCDDTIKFLGIKEDKQSKMSMTEVMTTAIVSASQYSGNLEKARRALKSARYIPNMLSKSQLNRRLLRIDKSIWDSVLGKLSQYSLTNEFIVDSFPIPACKLARRNRNKIYRGKEYIGYCAAKQEFYLGIKVHMITDVYGNPRQYLLLPASVSDIEGLRRIDLMLPKTLGYMAIRHTMIMLMKIDWYKKNKFTYSLLEKRILSVGVVGFWQKYVRKKERLLNQCSAASRNLCQDRFML